MRRFASFHGILKFIAWPSIHGKKSHALQQGISQENKQ
jgi:hypothetical protein